MRVAALHDVHGNLPALEAVLADPGLAAADVVVVGGDFVPGPMPHETLLRLRELGSRARFIRGNGERETLELLAGRREAREGGLNDAWIAEQLTESELAFLGTLPLAARVEVEGLGPVLFCHASPRADDDLFTEASPDDAVGALFTGIDEHVVVCGHTHMQFDRTVDGVRIVNAGSVGMPYDDQPGAYWALLGPDVSFRRTEYDVDRAAERIRAAAWPKADEFAAENVLRRPPRAEVLGFFETQARERA